MSRVLVRIGAVDDQIYDWMLLEQQGVLNKLINFVDIELMYIFRASDHLPTI